jgi:hypothetical protein
MRRWQAMSMVLAAAAMPAACTSASDVLQPSAITPQSTQSVPASPEAGTQTAAASPAPTGAAMSPTAPTAANPPARTAAVPAGTRLQIAPLVGASVEAAAPLTERLNLKARERGITLVGSADTSATNILKGYFSVLTEGKDTTVIYVWDLYDPAGNRLHRINGQQKAPSVGGAKGWAAVSPSVMQAVADATVDQLAAWLSGKTG